MWNPWCRRKAFHRLAMLRFMVDRKIEDTIIRTWAIHFTRHPLVFASPLKLYFGNALKIATSKSLQLQLNFFRCHQYFYHVITHLSSFPKSGYWSLTFRIGQKVNWLVLVRPCRARQRIWELILMLVWYVNVEHPIFRWLELFRVSIRAHLMGQRQTPSPRRTKKG